MKTLDRAPPWLDPALDRLQSWWMLGLAALAGASVVAGAFEPTGSGWIWQVLTLVGLVAASTHDVMVRREGFMRHPFGVIEGPLLWLAGAFIVTRLGGDYAGHLFVIPGALVAWLVATRPVAAWAVPAVFALALELGLTLTHRQGAAALIIHIALASALAYAARRVYGTRPRRRLEVGPTEAPSPVITGPDLSGPDSAARDFGLLTAQAAPIRTLPALARLDGSPTVGRMTLDFLDASFAIHLDLLRQTLGLTSAVVLWRGAEGATLKIRGCSSSREDILEGPFSMDKGAVASVFRDTPELAVAPASARGGGLPYYRDGDGVGAFFALGLSDPADALSGEAPLGVLCVDRADPRPWTEAERQVLRLSARKIALDVETGRALKDTDRERRVIQRFCAGLRALNGVLGLEEVAEAALDSVAAMAPFDFGAVTTFNGALHKVVAARGLDAERLEGLTFAVEEGLVGKAVQSRTVLPATGVYRGARPIFTEDDRLTALKALLIIPLIKKGAGQGPLGALVVGATDAEAYASPRREMVELVASQVAIKLDLAQAHEQIREMATLDGLTGLSNHRVFQQAFDNMLNRATRQQGQVCLLLTDIDRFKSVNDTYGHPFGDKVLKSVAKVLAKAARKVDLAARYGGEEFAILLEGTGEEGGVQMAERIRAEVQSLMFDFEGRPVQVTLSLGVAAYPANGLEKTELIARADEALYHAKRSGRNRTVAASTLPGEAGTPAHGPSSGTR